MHATITRRTRNLGFAANPSGPAPVVPAFAGTTGIVVRRAEVVRASGSTAERWFLGDRAIHGDVAEQLAALAAGDVDSVDVEVDGDPRTKRPAAGRPETGTVITVRIPDEVLAACDAQPEGRAGFIRLAVERALAGPPR